MYTYYIDNSSIDDTPLHRIVAMANNSTKCFITNGIPSIDDNGQLTHNKLQYQVGSDGRVPSFARAQPGLAKTCRGVVQSGNSIGPKFISTFPSAATTSLSLSINNDIPSVSYGILQSLYRYMIVRSRSLRDRLTQD